MHTAQSCGAPSLGLPMILSRYLVSYTGTYIAIGSLRSLLSNCLACSGVKRFSMSLSSSSVSSAREFIFLFISIHIGGRGRDTLMQITPYAAQQTVNRTRRALGFVSN